jgi:hypothetical protein
MDKNIFLIPCKGRFSTLHFCVDFWFLTKKYEYSKEPFYIYITSEEKPKDGDWVIETFNGIIFKIKNNTNDYSNSSFKKIILTNNPILIKDGVQAIDDEFIEWFVKNSSCEFVEVVYDSFEKTGNISVWEYKIIIPKEEPKQNCIHDFVIKFGVAECQNCGIEQPNPFELPKTLPDDVFFKSLEEPKKESFNEKRGLKEVQLKDPNTCEYFKEVGCMKNTCSCYTLTPKKETLEEIVNKISIKEAKDLDLFIKGVKWQQEQDKKMYSEEEVLDILFTMSVINPSNITEWFNQFKNK